MIDTKEQCLLNFFLQVDNKIRKYITYTTLSKKSTFSSSTPLLFEGMCIIQFKKEIVIQKNIKQKRENKITEG